MRDPGNEVGLVISWFVPFRFQLRQCSFHWIISFRVVNGFGRNENVLILPTSLYDSAYDSDSRFSPHHKRSYDFKSKFDFVAKENHVPLKGYYKFNRFYYINTSVLLGFLPLRKSIYFHM